MTRKKIGLAAAVLCVLACGARVWLLLAAGAAFTSAGVLVEGALVLMFLVTAFLLFRRIRSSSSSSSPASVDIPKLESTRNEP